MTFDAFNVFPRHYFQCFPFPNQRHDSVLIDLTIRCNWPSITFHSKLIFISIPNQRKECYLPKQRHYYAGPLKEDSEKTGVRVDCVILQCRDLLGDHLLQARLFRSHRALGGSNATRKCLCGRTTCFSPVMHGHRAQDKILIINN